MTTESPFKFDGFLGIDRIGKYDLDIDFPHNRVGLYRPRNCNNGIPEWDMPYDALPIAPLGRALTNMMISVDVDGKQQNAEIDTGSSGTVLDRARALALGVTPDALAADRQITVRGATTMTTSALHRFTTIKVGNQISTQPLISVTDLPNADRGGHLHMLLGNDYLRRHRLWISHENFTVYVARPAQSPDTAVAPK
jgi:hypothetical protein